MTSKCEKLTRLNARLEAIIQQLDEGQMPETAALLRIAQLDLTVRTLGISAGDLEAMIFAAKCSARTKAADSYAGGFRKSA